MASAILAIFNFLFRCLARKINIINFSPLVRGSIALTDFAILLPAIGVGECQIGLNSKLPQKWYKLRF